MNGCTLFSFLCTLRFVLFWFMLGWQNFPGLTKPNQEYGQCLQSHTCKKNKSNTIAATTTTTTPHGNSHMNNNTHTHHRYDTIATTIWASRVQGSDLFFSLVICCLCWQCRLNGRLTFGEDRDGEYRFASSFTASLLIIPPPMESGWYLGWQPRLM